MTQREALEVLARHRGDRVVLATMGAIGLWPALSDSPLDYHYMPSSMGQGVPVALGLALATGRATIALTGDGSMLMNLGCLVTVANHPAPLAVILIDNGLYEVTGGQPVAGSGRTDFAGLAKAAGLRDVYRFDDVAEWAANAATILERPGPTFVWLRVAGEYGKKTPSPPRPMAEQITRLRAALEVHA